MGTIQEPIEAIDAWQRWYKENKVVADFAEPLVTKDSREAMHDTTNAINSAKTMWMQKAEEHFAIKLFTKLRMKTWKPHEKNMSVPKN
jgi:hypothetical protein